MVYFGDHQRLNTNLTSNCIRAVLILSHFVRLPSVSFVRWSCDLLDESGSFVYPRDILPGL